MLEKGVYTSIVTPFLKTGTEIDWDGFKKNIEFQIEEGIAGILFVEVINGESATLSPEEHCLILEKGIKEIDGRVFPLAGTGSNSLKEALEYTKKAYDFGYKAAALVAPYCNPVSSYDIRENYFRKVARSFLKMIIIPHTIPQRTAVIEPVDLSFLEWMTPNICASIEIDDKCERIQEIERLTMSDFGIFSGDDTKTWKMITEARLSGVFSAIANIAPAAVCSMINSFLRRDFVGAENMKDALNPILISSIEQERPVFYGKKEVIVKDKIFNPVIIKTMMAGLGIPAGPCRDPLGKMNKESLAVVRNALKAVWESNPWVLRPVERFYGVDISERLSNDSIWDELTEH